MTRKIAVLIILLYIAGTVSGQNISDEQIRSYAKELGVPVDELRLLIEKHKAKKPISIFQDPRADTAQIIDIPEADFMKANNSAQHGKLYQINRTNCYFSGQRGDSVVLWTINPDNSNIVVKATSVYRINSKTPVDVLLQYRRDGRSGDFYIVEIVY
jgi:hypothetical protein